jgi:hypothetical protein
MRNLLNEEINRVRYLMNLSKILLEHTITDDLLKSIVTKLVSETGSSKEIDNFLLGLNKIDTLGDKINSWSKLQSNAKSLGKTVSEIAPSVSDDLFKFFVSNGAPESIQKSFRKIVTKSVFGEDLLEVYTRWNKGANLSKEEINTLKTEMLNLYNSLENQYFKTAIDNTNIIKRIKGEVEPYYKTQTNISPKAEVTLGKNLEELETKAKDNMKKTRSMFRSEIKKSIDNVISKIGVSWDEILGPEVVQNTNEALDLLEKLFPNRKFYYGDGSRALTIAEIRQELLTYKGIRGPNGEWSSVNFLDTNSLDNTDFFIEQAKKRLSEVEYENLIRKFSDGTITEDDKIFRKVLNDIENDTKLWENMVANPSQYLKNIPKTTASGSEGEEIANTWFNYMGDVKVLWKASPGSPIDRLLGIDFILDVAGETSTVNVKKITGTIYKEINANDVLGDSYKIWTKYGLGFSKQTNLTYGVIVDSNGSFIMFKKQPEVDWVLRARTSYQRFPSCQAKRCVYVDKSEGVRVHFNEENLKK